jgi:hypothetical protein
MHAYRRKTKGKQHCYVESWHWLSAGSFREVDKHHNNAIQNVWSYAWLNLGSCHQHVGGRVELCIASRQTRVFDHNAHRITFRRCVRCYYRISHSYGAPLLYNCRLIIDCCPLTYDEHCSRPFPGENVSVHYSLSERQPLLTQAVFR